MEPADQETPQQNVPLSYAEPGKKRSALAVAALVCGLAGMPTSYVLGIGLPLSLAALILGITALVKMRRDPNLTGKTIAINAIFMSGIGFFLFGVCAAQLGHLNLH